MRPGYRKVEQLAGEHVRRRSATADDGRARRPHAARSALDAPQPELGYGGSGCLAHFSAITACYPEIVQIVVSKASGIKSVSDMRSKRICVGAVGSGYEVAARQILGIYNMTYDDIDERFLSQSEAKNALQDDQIDAFFMCSGYPNANVTELSLTGKRRQIGRASCRERV